MNRFYNSSKIYDIINIESILQSKLTGGKTMKKKKYFPLYLTIIIGFIFLLIFIIITEKSKYHDPNELFPDAYWNEGTTITYYDFDETKYVLEDPSLIQEFRTKLLSLTYKEVRNPQLEGWELFEISNSSGSVHLSTSGRFMNINGKTYTISGDSVGSSLSEYVKTNSNYFIPRE